MYKAENLSGDELIERLVFNKEDIEGNKIDFTWIHSREFRYNDEMYDVVKKEEDDKQIFLYCIHDEKEKRLEEEFEKRVHKNSTEDKQLPTTHNHFNISLSEPAQSQESGNDIVYESVLRFSRTDFYKSPHLDIPSPPPRTV